MNPDPQTPAPAPAGDADLLTARLLGEEPSDGAAVDDVDRLIAEQPQLRTAVADRLFVHGLLHSLADQNSPRRQERVARVTAALASRPAARTVRVWFARPALVAASLILAVGLGWAFLGGGAGGPATAEASATEIVERAREQAAPEADDLEYRVTVYTDDAAGAKVRESTLYLRGGKWAMRSGNVWMGSDGSPAGDWAVVPPREFPKMGPLPKKFRAEAFSRFLEMEVNQVRLAGLMEDMGKSYNLRKLGRTAAPGTDKKAHHVRGESAGEKPGGAIHQMDIWAAESDGVPLVVELRTKPRLPGRPARRMVYELIGRGKRPDAFYQKGFHEPAPARPAAPGEKQAT